MWTIILQLFHSGLITVYSNGVVAKHEAAIFGRTRHGGQNLTTLVSFPLMKLKKLYRYGSEANSHDLIKAAAILLMIVDHIGLYLMGNNLWFRVIGRSAAPLFFFATGYTSKHKFNVSLLNYGIALTLLTVFTQDNFYLNILINFVLIKWVLDHYDPTKTHTLGLVVIFAGFIGLYIVTSPILEYGTFGLLFAIGARLMAEQDKRGIYWLAGSIVGYFCYESLTFKFASDIAYEMVLIVICLLLLAVFCQYRLRNWPELKFLNLPIMFLGRYSLEVYFIHLALLQIYSFWRA